MGECGRSWGAALLVFGTAAVVFGRVLGFGFLDWDDHLTLATNPALNPPAWGEILRYWREPHLALYVPVTYTVWGGLAFVGWDGQQLQAWPFRAASVVLHGLTAVVVMGVIRRVLRARGHPRAGAAALLGGLLFAVHPAQVESVAWASGLKDVLAGGLGWGAVWAGLVALDGRGRGRGGVWWGGWWVLAAALLAGAMLAKPSAVMFPVVFGVLGWAANGGGGRWRVLAGAVAMGLAMAVPAAVVAKRVQPPNDVEVMPVGVRPVLALDALAFYARHVVVPVPLAVDYARSPGVQRADSMLPVRAVVPVLLAVGVWASGRGWGGVRGELGAGLGVAVVLLVPVLGLVPFQFQRYSSVADHYLYAAMGGVALAGAGLVRARWAVGLGAGAVVVYGVMAAGYVQHWSDTRTLFEHNARVVPTSFAAQRVLGYVAARAGDDDTAEGHLRRAIALRPDELESRFNLGNLLLRRRDLEGAKAMYEGVLERSPGLAPAVLNLAVVYELQGDVEGARRWYVRLGELEPGSPAAEAGLRRLGGPGGER